MRVSANKSSPHFSLSWKAICVFLDGAELSDCVEADDVDGWAKVVQRDERGLLKHICGELIYETRRGTVEFRSAASTA